MAHRGMIMKKVKILVMLAIVTAFSAVRLVAAEGDRFLYYELELGYETVAGVVAGVNFIFPGNSNRGNFWDTVRDQQRESGIYVSRFSPRIELGWDFSGETFPVVKFGFFDRIFFDKSNGLRVCLMPIAAFVDNKSFDKSENKSRPGGVFTAGYVWKVARSVILNFDAGISVCYGYSDQKADARFIARVLVSFRTTDPF